MRAFHNDPEIKEKYLQRVREHAASDELIHGVYWQDGKGCAVGCTVHSAEHIEYEKQLGIPIILARLEDGIFEGLDNGRAKLWPEQFLSAINVGADLSKVWPVFAHWLLVDPADGIIKFVGTDTTKKSIQVVADLYKRWINGDKPTIDEWHNAASAYAAAYAASAYAAAAYAYASASAAASSAAYAAYAAAAYAAYAYASASAAASSAAYAAYAADAYASASAAASARIKQSERLLELLKESR